MLKIFKKISYLIKKAIFVYKKEGISPLFRRVYQFLKIKGTRGILDREAFDFIVDYKNLISFCGKKKHDLSWIIPDFAIGAGGHMTLFRIIKEMEKRGLKNRIHIYGPLIHRKKIEQFKKAINQHFIDLSAEIEIGCATCDEAKTVIASSWETSYEAIKYQNNKQKCFYFVQDFEPHFYPMGAKYLFAENSYKLGLYAITAGQYLSHKLRTEYGAEADFFDLAVDHNKYFPKEKEVSQKKEKIAFYARPVTPRRAFELGVETFKILKQKRDIEINFFGADTSYYNIPFDYINRGILNENELADFYNQMDLGVVFSLTNFSLVIREMMACKLPVLELNSPCNKFIFSHKKNIYLNESDPFSIVEGTEALLADKNLREKISSQALSEVKNLTWEKSGQKVFEILSKSI